MRFMMLVKATPESEAGLPPNPELMAAIGRLTEEQLVSGKLVAMLDGGGLLPSSRSARVKLAGGRVSTVDGPFTEAKELVGGYAIMEVRSMEDALELGREFMQVHAEVMGPGYEGELEIRPLFGPADLPGQVPEHDCEPAAV
ncbi:MAG: YciI family protein [Gemmatimonadota bacterium]